MTHIHIFVYYPLPPADRGSREYSDERFRTYVSQSVRMYVCQMRTEILSPHSPLLSPRNPRMLRSPSELVPLLFRPKLHPCSLLYLRLYFSATAETDGSRWWRMCITDTDVDYEMYAAL